MRTFAILRLTTIVMGMAGAFLPATAHTEESSTAAPANCEGIAGDLGTAIKLDPSKVLMLIEDALVINEGCAGEVVRAAIVASGADADLAKQIVETSVNVAPNMAVAINEAAAGIMPTAVVASVTTPAAATVTPTDDGVVSGEGDKVVAAVDAYGEEEEEEGLGFGTSAGSSLRGIYFVQAPSSGMPSSDVLRKYANVSTSPCACTP